MASTLYRLAQEYDGAELSKALREFGFGDLLAEEPREAVSSLFDAIGYVGAVPAALQDVLLAPLSQILGKDVADHSVVIPTSGARVAGSLERNALNVRGLVIGSPCTATAMLVPVGAIDGIAWVRITDPSLLSSRLIAGLDPALAMTEVTVTGLPATVVLEAEPATLTWKAVVTAGRLALGYQIVGAVSRMIDLAVDHSRSRVQFGRPIGSFQAVRNRLAEAYVAREGAASALLQAWNADDQYLAGMLAKSLAGRAARIAATQCQQVLAGVGFTAEHPFHRFLVRALVLDSLLGSAAELPSVIGTQLVLCGSIPRLVQL
ncbi:acyl-CoA dehydrogenase family protein [Nocardia sp. NBC_00565]|uniref:acyl-CoA dehydrogenase family protein n=1 Tax=Nocardia sp. NBC_00565 TaxID=2975993 RepID=UPI002E80BA1B|nr:acyl-CoA dehydrogenase family protein [Nocardia sp. NBC_00565]WUC05604.1 acyl-CoA dehydrogenase family protein [Nocardia sp. NBC_00565]